MMRFFGKIAMVGGVFLGGTGAALAQGSAWTGDPSRIARVDAIVADARLEVARESGEKGCASNQAFSCMRLSFFYRKGSRTTPADPAKVELYRERALALGRAACSMETAKGQKGCGDLGRLLYLNDVGTPPRLWTDTSPAVAMLKTGCLAQNGDACHDLGTIMWMRDPQNPAAIAASAVHLRSACDLKVARSCTMLGRQKEAEQRRAGGNTDTPEIRAYYARALAIDPEDDSAADALATLDFEAHRKEEEKQRLINSGFTPEQVETKAGG